MQINRYEKLEIIPDKEQTVEDIQELIEKTQDLELDSIEALQGVRGFRIVVKRELECFPDTIKR